MIIIKIHNTTFICVQKSIFIDFKFNTFYLNLGFHSPTMSWPVAQSLMIEPTESESLDECDRLCNSLIMIREEIKKIELGHWTVECNPLKMAPHTMEVGFN